MNVKSNYSFGDLRDMLKQVTSNSEIRDYLTGADIMSITAPCQGRSVLRALNKIDPKIKFKEDELFSLSCTLVKILKPKRIFSEMTPPNAQFSEDHYVVSAQLESLGYDVTVTERLPSHLCKGDIQSRDRWILIGRLRRKGNSLLPFSLTARLNHAPRPLSEILDKPATIAPGAWIKDFIQIFPEPEPHVQPMQIPAEYEFIGGTKVTNFENCQLHTILSRLRNENLTDARHDGYLTIGPYASRELMTNPLIAKLYTLIHNIFQRTSAKSHPTYLIDIFENQSSLIAASKLKRPSQSVNSISTFTVGYYKGGGLVIRKPLTTAAPHTRAPWTHQQRVNTCQSVYFPSCITLTKESKHEGSCFRITSVASPDSKEFKKVRSHLLTLANSYIPNTIVLEPSGLLNFLDPYFTIESKHLACSGYIGHLPNFKEKGGKIYSIHAPCPTYTGHNNVLILDQRSTHHRGVRNLTKNEVIRLNNYPPEIESFLHSLETPEAAKYIANGVPCGMLHTIYEAIISDLDREFESGGDESVQTVSTCYNHHIFKLTCKQPQAYKVDQYVMANLFQDPTTGTFKEIDLDVAKRKELPPVKVKALEEPDPSDTTDRSRRRMADWKRTFHGSNEQAKRSMQCTYGHGLKQGDTRHSIETVEDLLRKYDSQPARPRHNPQPSRMMREYAPGEAWSLDGCSIGRESLHGHKHVITFVELYSKKPLSYYIRTNKAEEFKAAVEYLRFSVKTRCNGREVKALYSDMFRTYMQFVGEDSIAEYRKYHGIHLRVAPPYAHWRNTDVEKINQIGRRGTRARLSQLNHKMVGPNNDVIIDPLLYWPYAWEHTMQCFAHMAATSPEKIWHRIATPNQWLKNDFTCELVNMQPFGETCFVFLEPDMRHDPTGDTPAKSRDTHVRACYLMSGQMNSLQNRSADLPECHIVLTKARQIKTVFTQKVKFPHLRGITHLAEGNDITPVIDTKTPEQVDLEEDSFVPPEIPHSQLRETPPDSTGSGGEDKHSLPDFEPETSPGAEETKDSEPEENELSSLQEGTHLVFKRTDDNADNTLHVGKVVSPYNSRDKSVEIQHFIDLGKSGIDFGRYKHGRSKLSDRILQPEMHREDRHGNVQAYTEGRSTKLRQYDNGYPFLKTYSAGGRISLILAKNFQLEKGTKVPSHICKQVKEAIDALKANLHLHGCIVQPNPNVEQPPFNHELNLLSAHVKINAPEYVGNFTEAQANLLEYLAIKAGILDVKSSYRANVRPPSETSVRSVDMLTSSNPAMHELARVLCNICERQIPGFDRSSIDSIQLNGNQVMEPHEDDINKTDSYVVAVGNFSGGRLHIQKDGKDKPSTPYNIRNRILRFNGQLTHSVEPFSAAQPNKDATRISFVLYKRLPGRPTRNSVAKALHAISTTPSSWDTQHLFTMPSLHELWHHDVALVFDKDNPKSYKRVKSRRRFLQYCNAATIREYFELGATPQDFRNDMAYGIFHFADPNLWTLQSLRGANWEEMTSGGEVNFGCYRTLLQARKSTRKKFSRPKVAKRSSIPCEFAEQLFRTNLYHPLSDPFNLAREKEYLLRLKREDSTHARALGLTPKQFYAIKYAGRELVYANGCETDHLYGNSTDLDEQYEQYFQLCTNLSHWCDDYDPDASEPKVKEPETFWVYVTTVTPDNKVIVDETQLIDLRKIKDPTEKANMMKAILKEIQTLVQLGTFELEPLPANHRPIDSRIVLKVKYRADGKYERHKARLVARGFLARIGIDFYSTFSPMACLTAVRLLCSFAVQHGLPLRHSDIPSAFIQSDLDSDSSWMKLPTGVKIEDHEGNQHSFVKLRKALYGLKQSPQLWNKTLTQFFVKDEKFYRGKSETSMFLKHVDGKFLIVLTEVDDLVYTGSPELIKEFEATLYKKWNITECGPLSSFMGINIHYDISKGILTFDVEEKVKNIFRDKPYLQDMKTIPWTSLPMDPNGDKRKARDSDEIFSKLRDPKEYASVVGAMIYISTTCRPDITQAVGRVSRKMHAPDDTSIAQLRTLLGYLKQNSSLKLTYYRHNHPLKEQLQLYGQKDSQLFHLLLSHRDHTSNPNIRGSQLFGESDADYGSKLEESRKSTSGYVFFFAHNLICWRSKLQPIIATSTHESELIALHIASHEAIWLRNLVAEFKACVSGLPLDEILDDPEKPSDVPPRLSPTFILGDNRGSVHTLNNPVQSKHIEIRYMKNREYQEQKRLVIRHIDGKQNIADLFTKPLTLVPFQNYLRLMGIKGKKSTYIDTAAAEEQPNISPMTPSSASM